MTRDEKIESFIFATALTIVFVLMIVFGIIFPIVRASYGIGGVGVESVDAMLTGLGYESVETASYRDYAWTNPEAGTVVNASLSGSGIMNLKMTIYYTEGEDGEGFDHIGMLSRLMLGDDADKIDAWRTERREWGTVYTDIAFHKSTRHDIRAVWTAIPPKRGSNTMAFQIEIGIKEER